MQQKRRLISIPIVHTHADFWQPESRVLFEPEVEEMKTRYWHRVFEYVRNLPVDFSKLKVYQDGLPDTSTEIVTRIVDETQTPNYIEKEIDVSEPEALIGGSSETLRSKLYGKERVR